MENTNQLKERYPHCKIVEVPTLFSHVAEEEMNFYCDGIRQGRSADGKLTIGEKVFIQSKDDPHRPWIITEYGVFAQVEGKLRSISL